MVIKQKFTIHSHKYILHTSLEDTLIIITDTKVDPLLLSIDDTYVCMCNNNNQTVSRITHIR